MTDDNGFVVSGIDVSHDEWVGVLVHDKGLGMLEDNDITAKSRPGVTIASGGNPTLRRNRIHDGKRSGVCIYENGLGTLEDNDITGNGIAGIEVRTGAAPTVRGNRINSNSYWAIWIYQSGKGVYEDNDLTDNAKNAWKIDGHSDPGSIQFGNRE
jgi:parallel beta-helix repeat protein